jgi:hypothetical protein
MFDRVGDLAEKLATNVSRRTFLGRLGQGALGLTAALGGVLAFPKQARAGSGAQWCCVRDTSIGCFYYVAINNKTCPCGGRVIQCKEAIGCIKSSCK